MLAVAWTLAKAPHIVPIPETRAADRLEEWAAAADFDLDPARLAELERVLPVGFDAGGPAMGGHSEILSLGERREKGDAGFSQGSRVFKGL